MGRNAGRHHANSPRKNQTIVLWAMAADAVLIIACGSLHLIFATW